MKHRHSIDKHLADRIEDLTGITHAGIHLAVPSFRTILVATNGSPVARQAIDWACLLAKTFTAALHVTSVAAPAAKERERQRDSSLAFERGITNADEVLRAAADRCATDGVVAVPHLATGSPVPEILAACQRLQTDLLVVGAGNEGKLEFTGTGSVAHQLKAAVPHAILIARAWPTTAPVLCGVDGSRHSHVAARVALGMAHLLGTSLVVFHARAGGGPLHLPKPTKAKPWQHEPKVAFETATGDAASALVARGRDLGASLVVLGGRGLGAVPGWGLGSVSGHASAGTDASVLVVKTD